MSERISLETNPLYTAKKVETISKVILDFPNARGMGEIVNVSVPSIGVTLYRNSPASEPLFPPVKLGRGQSVSVRLHLQLSPEDKIFGSGVIPGAGPAFVVFKVVSPLADEEIKRLEKLGEGLNGVEKVLGQLKARVDAEQLALDSGIEFDAEKHRSLGHAITEAARETDVRMEVILVQFDAGRA
jgi:hypothetical protein